MLRVWGPHRVGSFRYAINFLVDTLLGLPLSWVLLMLLSSLARRCDWRRSPPRPRSSAVAGCPPDGPFVQRTFGAPQGDSRGCARHHLFDAHACARARARFCRAFSAPSRASCFLAVCKRAATTAQKIARPAGVCGLHSALPGSGSSSASNSLWASSSGLLSCSHLSTCPQSALSLRRPSFST